MIYQIFYYMMIIGFFGCSIQIPSPKMKIVGILLTIVNAILLRK